VTVRAHSEQVVGGVGPEKSVSQLIWEIFPIDVREALQQTLVRPARTPSIRREGGSWVQVAAIAKRLAFGLFLDATHEAVRHTIEGLHPFASLPG
jgi:hypothetical protein